MISNKKAKRGCGICIAGHKGMTISELLISIVMILLVSMILVVGTNLAMKSYYKVVDESNAEVLLSTAMTKLRTEFVTAKDVSVSGNAVTYRKGGTGYVSTISMDDDTDQIFISEYGTDHPLVGEVTATNSLRITYGSVAYADGVITVSDLAVVKTGKTEPLAFLDKFSVNCH